MIRRTLCLALAAAMLAVMAPRPVKAAPTEIQLWHAMGGQLGVELNGIVDKFNASQSDYKVVPVFKGSYPETMAAGIAAFRAGNAPAILQVFEVGTATMMAAKKAIVPVHELFQKTGVPVSSSQFIPTIAGYYSEAGGLASMPFNSSTAVLYWNKDAFKKAGLDPNTPPKTWDEVAADAAKLKAAGLPCGFTTGWQGWIQIEQFSAWHGLPIASYENGFKSLATTLEFNGAAQVRHIALLQQMAKDKTFTYVGRTTEATPKFFSGDCGIMTDSSGSYANIAKYAKFDWGVGMMPYDPTVKGAPQNAIIGGASLWVLSGKNPEVYKGVAKFFQFLSSAPIAAQWAEDTGYLPVTKAGNDLMVKQGFYAKHPGSDIAIRQMLLHPPLPWTRGLRLGYMPQIRTIVDEDLESVWSGKESAKAALDDAVTRGDQLLRRFQSENGG